MPSNIELVKLHAAIADIDEKLQKLKTNHTLPAGKKLLEQYACGRERRKLELQVNLIHEKRLIERLERQCEFYQTPLGKVAIEGERHTAKKHHQRRLAGLGFGGSSTPYRLAQKDVFTPPDPAAAASIALTRAREQHAKTSNELEKLGKEDAREAKEALVDQSLPRIRGADENSQPSSPRSPNQSNKPNLNYRSPLRKATLLRLTQEPKATNRELCNWFDDEGAEFANLPPNLAKNGNRSFADAYLDSKPRRLLESTFSKVRGDMRALGLLK